MSKVIGLSVLTGTGARQTDRRGAPIERDVLQKAWTERWQNLWDYLWGISEALSASTELKAFSDRPCWLSGVILFNRCLWRFVRFNRHRFLWRDLSLLELVLSGFIQTVSGFGNQNCIRCFFYFVLLSVSFLFNSLIRYKHHFTRLPYSISR